MRRDRVAVLGEKGIFEDSIVATLASNRSIHVRQFLLDVQATTSREICTFHPDVVVFIGGRDHTALQNVIPPTKKGVAIVALDPTEPNMSLSYLEEAPATLNSVLTAVRAARTVLHSKRTSERSASRERKGEV